MITVIPFDTEDEAIEISNDSPYGLYDYVFGRHRPAMAAGLLRASNIGINTLQRNHEAAPGGVQVQRRRLCDMVGRGVSTPTPRCNPSCGRAEALCSPLRSLHSHEL